MEIRAIKKFWKKVKLKRIKSLPKTEQGAAKFHLEYGGKYSYGMYSYGLPNIQDWDDGTTCSIGRFCSIGYGVTIFLGGNHRTDWVSTYPFPAMFSDIGGIKDYRWAKGDVIIGNDVWVGSYATILSGVRIGHGAVVGANAVVVRDVPAYAVVAGNPARIVKYRFDNKIVEKLLDMEWWDWPEEKILNYAHLICSRDVESIFNSEDEHNS